MVPDIEDDIDIEIYEDDLKIDTYRAAEREDSMLIRHLLQSESHICRQESWCSARMKDHSIIIRKSNADVEGKTAAFERAGTGRKSIRHPGRE